MERFPAQFATGPLVDYLLHSQSTDMHLLRSLCILAFPIAANSAPIKVGSIPAELSLRPAGEHAVRVTLRPLEHPEPLPENPALAAKAPADAVLIIRELDEPQRTKVGELTVEIRPDPLQISVSRPDGSLVQKLTLDDESAIRFRLDDAPVLGMGEGGPRPEQGKDWRKAPVEFDRRGRLHKMQPRWQADAYGSRNPVPLLVGTGGWGLFFASPWGRIDLSEKDGGRFLPIEKKNPAAMRQNHANQTEQLGKGIPPMEDFVEGFRDVFVFDARDPVALMKDLSTLTGAAAMPPKWALGYMQSHRTLEDDEQLVEIADTFRDKRIPVDAVIYLGTGFTPRGWNKPQPSFEFNPEVFQRDPAEVIDELHERNVKVVVHMVPWDRDRIPRLDDERLPSYWKEHEDLVKAGIDGWWPDEGDWFDLHERITRHQLYHDGPLSTQPDRRPWSLHRNGYLGVARYGGWVWSGDTNTSWKTLEAQIAVGINHSLSLGPYWGSDIGGFYPSKELTGELYARWFQFGAFCPSFRSHGRTWWTRLPWGWGLDTLGPKEHPEDPDASTLNDPSIEKVCRRYAELRYQLLSYNYTLAWQARDRGLPFMRSLWLHYPEDAKAREAGDQYLWGRDLMIAPVFEKGATARELYLPEGEWFDFWTGKAQPGGRTVSREVDLATLPIYVRAGTILPLDPVRQHTGQAVDEPLTIRIYPGADGSFTLYEDDGDMTYLNRAFTLTRFEWDDEEMTLRLTPGQGDAPAPRKFRIEFATGGVAKIIDWQGKAAEVRF